jgi:glycosyltransferase 2 family protein
VDSIEAFLDATSAFGGQLSDVGFQALFIALVFHFANLILRATAWRNILVAAHPREKIRWRTVTGAYLSGIGVNSIVPARGGDVMKIYLVHRSVPDTPYTTITASLLAETLFDIFVGSTLLIWAFSAGAIPGTPDLSKGLGAFEFTFFAEHLRVFAMLLAVGLIALAIGFTWIEGHVNRFWDRVRDGLAILRTPQLYLRRVVVFQAIGWVCRAAAMFYFLKAFNIPADFSDAALALTAGSIATLMPLTPGGIGPQQALLVYMFRDAAARSAVLSFSVGMQFAVTVSNAIVGGICLSLMLRRLPWKVRLQKGKPDAAAAKP